MSVGLALFGDDERIPPVFDEPCLVFLSDLWMVCHL